MATFHSHRCANGHEWYHDESNMGSDAAHRCPVCGRESWWQHRRMLTPGQRAGITRKLEQLKKAA